MAQEPEQPVTKDFVDREIARLKEVLETRLKGIDQSTAGQIKETLRRLDELNHAHAQSVIDKAAFLPRETFDGFKTQFENMRVSIADKVGAQQLAGLESRLASIEIRGSQVASDAMKSVDQLWEKFNDLAKGTASMSAVEANQQHMRDVDRRLRWSMAGVVVTALAAVASLLVALLRHS